jgi:hypothetical protein
MTNAQPPVYPAETLDPNDDDGTMLANRAKLEALVVGHSIVKAEKGPAPSWLGTTEALIITLDDGTQVALKDTSDCCAYTDLEAFLLHPDKVHHVIMGVGTTEGYTKWHIYASYGDVLELTVGWSGGNLGYYGYGFDIDVVPLP